MTVQEHLSSQQDVAPIDPGPIFQLATGFMAAKHLFAANELGVFEALGESPASLESLSARCGITTRAARISADAMVALGLVERHGDEYRNSPVAAVYLSGQTQGDLRPLLRFWDKVSYPIWENLTGALGSGPVRELSEVSGPLQEVAQAGIQAATAGPLHALVETVDFTVHHRLLDVGGGSGNWSVQVAAANPHLHATVVDLGTVAPIAEENIATSGLSDRVKVAVADVLHDPLPKGHDVCVVANLIHYFSPAENETLLRQVRAAVEPGATLLIADFWTDPTHTQPVMAALMAGEFAVHIEHGDVYSFDEARAWLDNTGWAFRSHQPLAGPFSLVVARAI